MNEFRAGTYRKERVGGVWRSVCPRESTMSLLDVDPTALAEEGKRLVLLDVDNTLLPWRGDQIPESSFGWIEAAKAAGLKLCILSNTRHPERLHRIADQLGIQYLRGKFKPSTQMYVRALHDFGVKAPEAVMIGDQLFTDVLGANRSGIDAIWVRPMTERDFVGTKISRMGEKLARRTLDRHIQEDAAEDLPPNLVGLAALLQVPVVRQFVKFIIVGGSSTVIDVGLHFTLMFVIVISGTPLGEVFGQWLLQTFPSFFSFAKDAPSAAVGPLKVLTASVAILNSFYWNRRWTFGIKDAEGRLAQLQKFVAVSLIGMLLNTMITTSLNNIIEGHAKRSWAVATLVATIVVAFWNFAGQKFFAFKKKA